MNNALLRRLTAALMVLIMSLMTHPANADVTLTVRPDENRGVWEGWGCSLCWWGNGIGGSAYQDLYADLFFTQKTVTFFDKPLPGLGMNIVRYNIGGGGPGRAPKEMPAYKDIPGYWQHGSDPAPNAPGWDWTADGRQRAMLEAARKRGADKIEFFCNAPLWWMTEEGSSACGRLLPEQRRNFARYIATVTRYAKDHWGFVPDSLEPFNEPAAGWWRYPGGQEGCNLTPDIQREILAALRDELDRRGLRHVPIAASDENSIDQALHTYADLEQHGATAKIGQVNVHGYYGLAPYRDNAKRAALHNAVQGKRLWMTEFGDPDGSGMTLARQIIEDINFLRPTAWVYWQPAEPFSGWGLVNGRFSDLAHDTPLGEPTWVYTKYYVMAQFTRFLRPGDVLWGNDDPDSLTAYNAKAQTLTVITLSGEQPRQIICDLSHLAQVGASAAITETRADGSQLLHLSTVALANKRLCFEAAPNAVYSVVISHVRR